MIEKWSCTEQSSAECKVLIVHVVLSNTSLFTPVTLLNIGLKALRGNEKCVQKRQKSSHTVIDYSIQMWVIHNAEIVTVNCVREFSEYSHTLKNSDCYKQLSAFCVLIIREMINDYSVQELTYEAHWHCLLIRDAKTALSDAAACSCWADRLLYIHLSITIYIWNIKL